MTEAVFPDAPTTSGVLPFSDPATIVERDDTPVVACKVSIFSGSESPQPVGQQAVFQAFADKRAAVCVGKQNLKLVIDESGDEYRIVGATHHRFAGYVELELRQVRANG